MAKLDITQELEMVRGGEIVIFRVDGYLDAHTFPQLESSLNAEIEAGQHHFVLNMGKLTYISSAGLGVLLGVLKRLQTEKGDLILTNVPDKIKRVVDLLGFSKLFKIYKTEELALADLRKPK